MLGDTERVAWQPRTAVAGQTGLARSLAHLAISVGAVSLSVMLLLRFGVTNPTTVALALLVVVLLTATLSKIWVAIVTATVATAQFNFFFFPPVGTFTIADPGNWVAVIAFLIVGIIASQLSATAQARARDAVARRNELARLFDLSRDILLTTERTTALGVLARRIALRFALPAVAVCLPEPRGWTLHQGGDEELVLDDRQLDLALAQAGSTIEFDARQRTYGGHARVAAAGGRTVSLVPLRFGARAVGLLASPADVLEPGTLDAVAGVVAIAVERTQLLTEREQAELVRQKADLASTLLASLSHDLRTPLTAIRVAVGNLQDASLPAEQRTGQARLALTELDRLTRLFRDILDMARIDAAALDVHGEWVTPSDIVDAALANLQPILQDRRVDVDAEASTTVRVDPRLTSTALSHLLENATQYSPADRPIAVRGWVDAEGLHLDVTDRGPGLEPEEMDRLFERFYRGRRARERSFGTGMGLAITRGLLAAERGRIWGENVDGGGARFSIAVPGPSRPIEDAE